MNSDFSAARALLDAAEAKREEVLLRHIANGVMIESRTVRKEMEKLGLRCLTLETDYSTGDAGQLSTRLEAFLEML